MPPFIWINQPFLTQLNLTLILKGIVNHVEKEYGYLPSIASSSNPGDAICVTCLGLLQPHTTSTLVNQVVTFLCLQQIFLNEYKALLEKGRERGLGVLERGSPYTLLGRGRVHPVRKRTPVGPVREREGTPC